MKVKPKKHQMLCKYGKKGALMGAQQEIASTEGEPSSAHDVVSPFNLEISRRINKNMHPL